MTGPLHGFIFQFHDQCKDCLSTWSLLLQMSTFWWVMLYTSFVHFFLFEILTQRYSLSQYLTLFFFGLHSYLPGKIKFQDSWADVFTSSASCIRQFVGFFRSLAPDASTSNEPFWSKGKDDCSDRRLTAWLWCDERWGFLESIFLIKIVYKVFVLVTFQHKVHHHFENNLLCFLSTDQANVRNCFLFYSWKFLSCKLN